MMDSKKSGVELDILLQIHNLLIIIYEMNRGIIV